MNEKDFGVQHANVVKGLHKSLRKKIRHGLTSEQVWYELLDDTASLGAYSHAMHMLAQNHWQKGSSSCRVTWCHHVCLQYFLNGGILKVIKKQEKTKQFCKLRESGMEENITERNKIDSYIAKLNIEMFWTPSYDNNVIMLLDVGSCFNPFKEFKEFIVVAIDISPATEDVSFCDFLNLNFDKSRSSAEFKHNQLTTPAINSIIDSVKNSLKNGIPAICMFDVVVFSLLLSYFPAASQRFQCCINAHKSLKMHGLLLIVTPDSSHQNRHTAMMKSWNTALQGIGFSRYKYEKLQHLHCMAFRKSSELTINLNNGLAELMYIPQDSHDSGSDDNNVENDNKHDDKVCDTSESKLYDAGVFSNIDLF